MKKITDLNLMDRGIIVLTVCALLSYILHVFLGTLNYPGYQPLSQAISDLTADDSPSKTIARFFSGIYGITSSVLVVCLVIRIQQRATRLIRLGIYFAAAMYITSAVGYALFPLSESGLANTFNDIMHMGVTGVVVLLTITSMIILMIGLKKYHDKTAFYYSVIIFSTLLLGSVLIGVLPKAYFGVAERMSVYAVVAYLGFISLISVKAETQTS